MQTEVFRGGASQRAWIDANGYLVAWTKALFPGPRTASRLSPGQRCRYWPGTGDSLTIPWNSPWSTPGLPEATTCWRRMRRTAMPFSAATRQRRPRGPSWAGRPAGSRRTKTLLRQPPLSTITVLVERGDTTAEIAALMFRQSGSPELVSTERVPLPDASRRPIVVAAGIQSTVARTWAGACWLMPMPARASSSMAATHRPGGRRRV